MRSSFRILLIIAVLSTGTLFAQEKIKPGLNMLKSAVVPGWGQLSLDKNYGYGFLLVETGFWTLNWYYNSESNNKEEASIKYAAKYADINTDMNYSEQFYEDMRHYISSGYDDGGYNSWVASEAAELYPDDPLAQQEYIEMNSYDNDHYWKWEDADNQRQYSVYRKRIEEYSDYLKVLGGAIAANHIISAFDALRLSNLMKRMQFGVGFNSEKTPLLSCTIKF